MTCKIAELGVEVPALGSLPERCRPYEAEVSADITIPGEAVIKSNYPNLSEDDNYYMNSAASFYVQMLRYNGLMLHASAVVVDGLAYLFSGPSGMGKSTHTSKYVGTFPDAVIINDDKPALRRLDDRWVVFGTPWCGKDGINANLSAPLAGICFLHRGDRAIRRLSPLEALPQLLKQTVGRGNAQRAELLMHHVNLLLQDTPCFDFHNHAEAGDELVTYETMREAFARKEEQA